jgi:PAS domain S-box-containing protein
MELTGPTEKKKLLKDIITQLHAGKSPAEIKVKFKKVLESTTPEEVAKIEQELVEEGMPREEILSMCDVHLAVFQEQLEAQKAKNPAPAEHFINILMEEHKVLQQHLEKLRGIVDRVAHMSSYAEAREEIGRLKGIADDFMEAEKHYKREENVLFPILEKHGVSEPPAIMWMEHNKLREAKKRFSSLVQGYSSMDFKDFRKQLAESAENIITVLGSHLLKENNILFPTALRVVTDEEWKEARREFDAIGYPRFTPKQLIAVSKVTEPEKTTPKALVVLEGILNFETGALPQTGIEALLKTLPVDITFVDAEDTVKYFNKSEIFLRTKAVIGRKVQQCHPQKSVHVVNRILDSFRSGRKDVAEFWINMKGRMIHIRYFAVRSQDRKYLGTVEVTQDVTDIKQLEGEKRLLDWND